VGVGGAGEFFECVDGDDPGRDGCGEVLEVESMVEGVSCADEGGGRRVSDLLC